MSGECNNCGEHCLECKCTVLLEKKFLCNKESKIMFPEYRPSPEEISKFMRTNVDILKQELTDHVDKEIERLNKSIKT